MFTNVNGYKIGEIIGFFILGIIGVILLLKAKNKESNAQTGYCRYCGSKLPEDAIFCSNCSAKPPMHEMSTGSNADLNDGFGSGRTYSNSYPEPKKNYKGVIISVVVVALLLLTSIVYMVKVLPFKKNHINTEKFQEEYIKGDLSSSTYKSKFIGFKYEAPSDWMLYPEEKTNERQEMFAIGEGEFDFDSVSVMIQELPSSEISEIMYMDNAKQRLENYDSMEYGEKKIIAGKEYHTLLCENIKQTTTICCRRIGNYMISVIITINATSSRTVDEIIGHFSKY